MLVGNRLRRLGELMVASLALALVAAPSAGAALPGGYTPTTAENPAATATAGDRFGANIVNAGDVNGDGRDDLMVGVPDSPGGLPGVTGKVVFVDGLSGAEIATVRPPQEDTLISHSGEPTGFGAQVVTIGDLNGDGVPEHVVSAPGSDISSSAVDMGIVYVLNGSDNQILKRIELEAGDRPDSSPGFGKSVSSAAGMPPCVGFGGTAPCTDESDSPVARGDLDGDGTSEIVIGAPDYEENAATETNINACPATGPATCPGIGRVYVYSGADITGSASAPLDSPLFDIQYFDDATAAQQPHFGAVVSPIGDVGACNFDETQFVPTSSSCLTATAQIAPSNVPDGYPDYLVSAPGLTAGGVTNAGKAFVVDGRHGLLIASVASPDAQPDSSFAALAYRQAPGNLGGSALPDLYLSAAGQDAGFTDQGRGYTLSGDPTAPSLLYRLDDPGAAANSGFGVFAGLGDVAGDDLLSEFALGRLNGGAVQVMSACGPTLALTIPAAEAGSDFGAAIAPMGDLNGDGYIDLAVGAPGHNSDVGRVYLMNSNGSAGPDVSCKPPETGGGGGGGGGSAAAGSAAGGSAAAGGSGGGGATTDRAGAGKRVSTLTKRRLALKPKRSRTKLSGAVKLRGRVRTSKKRRSCRAKQKVGILRFNPISRAWATIDVAVTGKKGKFAMVVRPPAIAQTYLYRARLKQTKRCAGAFSNRIKVKVTT